MKLWKTLQHSNRNTEITKAVKAFFYHNAKTKIKINKAAIMSSTLFKIYLEISLEDWKRKSSGMDFSLGGDATWNR